MKKETNILKKNYKFIFLILVIIMSFNAFATINYITNSVSANYSGGETMRGNVYLTISNHPSDSIVTSNFPGSITLLNWIKNNSGLYEGINYNCSAIGCSNDYYSSGSVNSVSLTSGQGKLVGFRVNGPGITITNAQFSVGSNAPSSCSPNLYVDVLADDEDILTSNQNSGQRCGVRHKSGCYDSSNSLEAAITPGNEYCEKMSIPATPSFIIGGRIINVSGYSNLTMKIYDFVSEMLIGSCTLPRHSSNIQTEELSCIVNRSSSSTRDYYVCVSSQGPGYKIGWETNSPNCGTAEGFNSLSSDFDLFAETMMYSASPNFAVNNASYHQMFDLILPDIIDNYIEDRYDRNCQSGCFIPIKISGENQAVSLSNARINYKSVGVDAESSVMYGLTYNASKITATNLSLDISKADFIIPIESTENKFKLYLDENKLFEKSISIRRGFAFDITPKVVAFGQNVKFRASSNRTRIESTTWNFGDGTAQQTVNGSEISHSYTSRNSSSFDITVTARNNQSLQATKQFKIVVGDPRIIANQTIIEYKRRITNITSVINSYPTWIIQDIQKNIDLGNMSLRISSIESAYNSALDESDFQDIMIDLINLNVPVAVATTSSGEDVPLGAGYESINVDYLEQIENKDVLDNSVLAEQVVGWMNEKFNPKISYKRIAKISEFDSDAIGTVFTIKTNPISSVNVKTYLIFGQDIEKSGMYKSNYSVKSISGAGVDYVVLDTSSSQIFEFVVYGDIDAETLGAFIAPSLSELTVVSPSGKCNINNICEDDESVDSCPEDCSTRWFKFTIFGWIILFIVAIVFYIILQEWYKKNYQKSLFPESNDLYNLVNFIYNARKSGLSDNDIRFKLRQQGWSGEKIRFVFRKIEGKRIAMLEIPLFTRKEHKNTITQISNRQSSQIDARFIKRQSY